MVRSRGRREVLVRMQMPAFCLCAGLLRKSRKTRDQGGNISRIRTGSPQRWSLSTRKAPFAASSGSDLSVMASVSSSLRVMIVGSRLPTMWKVAHPICCPLFRPSGCSCLVAGRFVVY